MFGKALALKSAGINIGVNLAANAINNGNKSNFNSTVKNAGSSNNSGSMNGGGSSKISSGVGNNMGTRAMGLVKVVSGGVQMVIGGALIVTPEPTMITKVGGWVAIGSGADDASTGVTQLWTGAEQQTLKYSATKTTVTSLGGSERAAENIATGVDIGAGFIGGGGGFAGNYLKLTKPLNAINRISSTNISYLTKAGKYPSWTAVQQRYWKLMNNGNAPQAMVEVIDNKTRSSKIIQVSLELHHINGRKISDPHNFNNLIELWPWEHAAVDPSRVTGYRFVKFIY